MAKGSFDVCHEDTGYEHKLEYIEQVSPCDGSLRNASAGVRKPSMGQASPMCEMQVCRGGHSSCHVPPETDGVERMLSMDTQRCHNERKIHIDQNELCAVIVDNIQHCCDCPNQNCDRCLVLC